jgi:hypothetical protein
VVCVANFICYGDKEEHVWNIKYILKDLMVHPYLVRKVNRKIKQLNKDKIVTAQALQE